MVCVSPFTEVAALLLLLIHLLHVNRFRSSTHWAAALWLQVRGLHSRTFLRHRWYLLVYMSKIDIMSLIISMQSFQICQEDKLLNAIETKVNLDQNSHSILSESSSFIHQSQVQLVSILRFSLVHIVVLPTSLSPAQPANFLGGGVMQSLTLSRNSFQTHAIMFEYSVWYTL